jgi:hypothetical protein
MGNILLAFLLACAMVYFLRTQHDIRRRIAAQKNAPKEELIPRHYKSFTEVEGKLWAAVQERKQGGDFEQTRFKMREPGFKVIRDYVAGVRDDFRRAHNIWGQIVIHCPEGKLFAQLEWERVKIEFAYYGWWVLSGLRLRTVGISIGDLRRLTEIVANFSYRVRKQLSVFEQGGHGDFVDSILRQS